MNVRVGGIVAERQRDWGLKVGYLYAIRAAFRSQLKMRLNPEAMFGPLISGIAPAALLAWIGSHGDDAALIIIAFGVLLMQVWHWGVFFIGWSLSDDVFSGTLDFNLASRTPVMLVIFGRAMATLGINILSGLVAFFTALAVFQRWVEIANLPMLLVSLAFTMFAVLAVSMVFAPMMLLVRGRAGFFNALQPFGVVFSGFLYPVSLLPAGLQTIARLLPMSWAMDGVILSTNGSESTWTIAGNLLISLTLSAAYLALTYYLFKKAEKRILVMGGLSAS